MILLVDGHNIVMRVIKAMEYSRAGLTDSLGENTGPLHTFAQSFLKSVDLVQPDRIMVCFDADKRNAMRMSVLPEYKANRPSKTDEYRALEDERFRLIREFLSLMHIPSVSRGDWEADDLLAHYVMHRSSDDPIAILTSDKDLLQLVCSDVVMIAPTVSGQPPQFWDEDAVLKKYGCRPGQLATMKALTGDKSDNISGIKGVGPKRALAICKEAEWNHDRITKSPRVVGFEDLFFRNFRVINLMSSGVSGMPPLDEYRPTVPGTEDWVALMSFCTNKGLERLSKSLLARF